MKGALIATFVMIIIFGSFGFVISLSNKNIKNYNKNLVCTEYRNTTYEKHYCQKYFERCTYQAKSLWTNIKQRNTENGTADKQSQEINKYIDTCLLEMKTTS